MKSYRIIISGGGTGGHIFPAISIANTLKNRFPDAEILFVGAEDRMEMEKVPEAGYRIVGLPIKGFDRSNKWNNVKVLKLLFKSLRMAKSIIKDFKPDIVQVQNLYPLLSTSIFKPLKKSRIPVVMRCPNYRLFCPSGLCLDNNGKVCESRRKGAHVRISARGNSVGRRGQGQGHRPHLRRL